LREETDFFVRKGGTYIPRFWGGLSSKRKKNLQGKWPPESKRATMRRLRSGNVTVKKRPGGKKKRCTEDVTSGNCPKESGTPGEKK